jgi:hypothetical protein
MPVEYPRVNGLPEWYVVETEQSYVLTDTDSGVATVYSGQELADGIRVSLQSPNDNLLLTVELYGE